MLSSDTRAVGCFVDVVWYELNASPERLRPVQIRNAPDPLSRVKFKSYHVIFATQNWVFFWVFSSDTMAMGCFVDVVWYELNLSPERHRPVQIRHAPDPFLASRLNRTMCFSSRNIGFPFGCWVQILWRWVVVWMLYGTN